MTVSLVPGVLNNGVILTGLATLPGTTSMLTVTAAGVIEHDDIPASEIPADLVDVESISGVEASGSNVAASDLILNAPRSTGNATPAGFVFRTTTAGSSGASLQTLADTLIVEKGEVSFSGQILSSGHGTVSLPAYSFDIGGNKAYGWWYGSGAIHCSINGVEIANFASGGFMLSVGTTANRLMGFSSQILNRTTSVTENAASQGGVITNAGAGSGTTSTLPSAVAGWHQTFIDNNTTHRLTVKPNTGDQLIWIDGTVVSPTGSVVSTARYDSFYCLAVDVTTWVVVHTTGTWTVTP